MMTAVALAAAMNGTMIVDEAGCRWIRPAPPVVAKKKPKPKKAAPVVLPRPVLAKPKPKRRSVIPKLPGDEFIGCDPEPDEPLTYTPVPDVPPGPIENPPEVFPPTEPPPVYAVPDEPETFEPRGGPPVFVWTPGYPPVFYGPPPAVPEPHEWALMLGGLALVAWRTKGKA